MIQGQTIQRIRADVRSGKLVEPFKPADVNKLLGIDWAGTFLPKHCEGNGYTTEHFIRVSPGLYRLKSPDKA
jgi:hypothetical protein